METVFSEGDGLLKMPSKSECEYQIIRSMEWAGLSANNNHLSAPAK